MTTNNWAQERQDQVPCEFIVQGRDMTWEEILAEMTIELSEPWAGICGGTVVPYLDYAKKEAELNHNSLERSALIALLNRGYKLEELEVTIDGGPEKEAWGKCVWYKDHPEYQKPISDYFKGTALNDPSFFYAMWKTEHEGDKNFGFYSMQMMASTSILPHKTFVYRRVVLSPPANAQAKAA